MVSLNLNEISIEEVSKNFFIGMQKEWFLITAGTIDRYNMMTAAWGGAGILWEQPVMYIFVRPSRYTYEFLNQNKLFSLNFLPEEKRKILKICGSKSGRNINKMEIDGLSPVSIKLSDETVYFKEADLVFICEKIFFQDLNSEQIPNSVKNEFYSSGDYHRMYVGKILKCYQRNES
ncbi:flavin reductase family protein [Candidatus Harpocratesius sp.]